MMMGREDERRHRERNGLIHNGIDESKVSLSSAMDANAMMPTNEPAAPLPLSVVVVVVVAAAVIVATRIAVVEGNSTDCASVFRCPPVQQPPDPPHTLPSRRPRPNSTKRPTDLTDSLMATDATPNACRTSQFIVSFWLQLVRSGIPR